MKDLLSNVGSGGGAPAAGSAPAAGGAAAAAEEAPKEEAKEEEKEESDDDMVRHGCFISLGCMSDNIVYRASVCSISFPLASLHFSMYQCYYFENRAMCDAVLVRRAQCFHGLSAKNEYVIYAAILHTES